MARIAAVIAGAGSGTRLGANMPKALVPLAGEPLIVHAVRGMREAGIDDVVVTIPAGQSARDDFAHALEAAGLDARLVVGGTTRQGSVANGIADLESEYVLVHDAARALTPPAVIRRVVDALLEGYDAVVPALAVTDTIKEIDDEAEPGPDGAEFQPGLAATGVRVERVARTLNRSHLRAMQTPQGFRTGLLREAHRAGEALSADEASAAPDDAALVEEMGEAVYLVEGSHETMKITTRWDLEVAELLAGKRDQA